VLTARPALGSRDAERMPAWAAWWSTWVSAAVVGAYRDAVDGAAWIPRDPRDAASELASRI